MTDNQPEEVSLDDCRIAAQAVAHWAAGDIEALNVVLEPLGDDLKRTQGVFLAVLQTCFGIAPELREPERIDHLRTVIAKLSDGGDTPKSPPTRIY